MAVSTSDYSLTASPGRELPIAVHAEGCRIRTADGREYLDACGGAMVMSLGHRHPRLVRGAEAAGRRADLHVPLLVRQRAHGRPRRADPRDRADGARLGLLQLLGVRVRGVGHPHGAPLLAAPRAAVEDRADLALPELPRLDPRRPGAVRLGLAQGVRARAGEERRRADAERRHPRPPHAGAGGRVRRRAGRGRHRDARRRPRRGGLRRADHGRERRRDRAAGRLLRARCARSATATRCC